MTRYVVDASVVVKWFVPEVHTTYALRLQQDQFDLAAPDLLLPEAANILWKKARLEEITDEEARLVLKGIQAQAIRLVSSDSLIELALEIAFDTQRTVYDSCYLALAEVLESTLVTADRKLFNGLRRGSHSAYLLWIEDIPAR